MDEHQRTMRAERKALDRDEGSFREGLVEHRINLSEGVISGLLTFRDQILSWNERVRLVSRRDGIKVLSRHVLESLLLVKHVEPDVSRLADVGSGGGFPGIPIGIARPHIDVSLIESARMKTLFLKDAVVTLGLYQAEVLHARAEEVARSKGGVFDVVTTRAVGPLDTMWDLAEPLLKHQGILVALKGPGEAEEELAPTGVAFKEHLVRMSDRTIGVVIVRKE